MFILRLDTRFDAEGIHYRMIPFLGWRTILWSNVQQATMLTYPLGYGLRHVDDVYNSASRLKGNDGLHIQQTNGRTVLIGTHLAEELKAFLILISQLPTEEIIPQRSSVDPVAPEPR